MVAWPRNYFNRLFQNREDLKWFQKVRGFDALLSLRGLEKVTFEIYGESDMKTLDAAIKAKIPENEKVMQELLTRELTKPKTSPVRVSL